MIYANLPPVMVLVSSFKGMNLLRAGLRLNQSITRLLSTSNYILKSCFKVNIQINYIHNKNLVVFLWQKYFAYLKPTSWYKQGNFFILTGLFKLGFLRKVPIPKIIINTQVPYFVRLGKGGHERKGPDGINHKAGRKWGLFLFTEV